MINSYQIYEKKSRISDFPRGRSWKFYLKLYKKGQNIGVVPVFRMRLSIVTTIIFWLLMFIWGSI